MKPTYEEMKERILNLEQEKLKWKQRAEEIREKGQRYDFLDILENIEDGYYEVDLAGCFIFFNDSICRIFGYSREELKGSPIQRYADEETAKAGYRIFNHVYTSGIPSMAFDWQITKGDGTGVYVEASVSLLTDGEGHKIGFRGIIRDITERKRTEAALRMSEEQYRTLVEESFDGIFIQKGPKIIFANRRLQEMLAYEAGQMEGMDHWLVYHPDYQEITRGRAKARMKGDSVTSRYEVKLQRKDGSSFDGEINAKAVDVAGEPGIQVWVRDITEQKEKNRLEAQLLQSQKMEAIGTLAGGIAHDFNNLLMGIQGRTSLMLLETESCHPHFEHLKGIEEYVKSAAALTRQLLGFARGGKYEVKPTDLNAILQKTSEMFGRTKKEVRIHRKLQDSIWAVEVDQGQIEQVFMNLYVNAWQAMPAGGELYLQSANVTLDESMGLSFGVKPGDYLKLSFTDTGVGMDERTQLRIFEPFFTTKEMGRGTGLGLASVYGIIKNHGGFINVFSKKAEGSTFEIYLPASQKKVVERKEFTEEIVSGSETILLVDDEELVIEVGSSLLRELGYEVIVARSGKEAIHLYEKDRNRIGMVVLDMVMPTMGGGETFDRLKEIRQDVKVLLSSGYSIDGQAAEIMRRGCDGFIQKPFSMKDLSHKMREILGKR